MQSHLGLNMNVETLSKLAAPATAKIRQLQKLVQDIKKNDGSLLNRLKRLKSKPRPNVPARDYQDDNRESDDQLSEPDYDNDMYECPREDDSYEPPPSHRVFPSTPFGSFPRGEYIDSCRTRPSQPPRKPARPGKQSKQLPAEPTPDGSDEEDYVDPDANTDDDNYVEPAENPPASRLSHSGSRARRDLPMLPPHVPERQPSPEFYEMPDSKENSSTSSLNRLYPIPPMQPHPLPPKPSPRGNMRSHSPIQTPTCDDEYEVCDPDDAPSDKPAEGLPPPRFLKPLPRPRSPKPPVGPKPEVKPKGESRTLPLDHTHHKLPPKPFTLDLKRPKVPFPQTASLKPERGSVTTESGPTDQDMDADIFRRPWFANTCDRKTADDALYRSNKDGAFMVRKSSGQDAQQPYTLVVFYNCRVYNIPIRFIPSTQQYALGREKKGEEFFSSVSHIIEHHQRNPLVLIDGQSNAKDATRLCYPVKP
ncbi:B-cell linker protein-like isoform X2 [Salarias fasciatus]|uniref:B-cell linker protein-like isoform X2 n=1 Tax=Salarias fasciatus TaxID=181472 RepID=UPI0011764AAC|nr:B-cell linker protein-like isoform X2 [Salarias fasciatus]XP_029963423.1 B-cell linker protein-like isoform X2 [Salarias fasciatus]